MVPVFPQRKMPHYLFDDPIILDKTDDFHGALTLRTQQGVHLVYFLDQARPVFTKFIGGVEVCFKFRSGSSMIHNLQTLSEYYEGHKIWIFRYGCKSGDMF